MQIETRQGLLNFDVDQINDMNYICFVEDFPDIWFYIKDITFGDRDETTGETLVNFEVEGKTPEMENLFSDEFIHKVRLFVEQAITETIERLSLEKESFQKDVEVYSD